MFPCFRKPALLALVTVVTACMERQPGELVPPVLGEVKVEAGYDSVQFTVQADGAWNECGVYFGPEADAMRKVSGERTEKGFTATVTDLEDEADFLWRVFVGNGRDEVLSPPGRVTTQTYPFVWIPDPAFKAWLVAHFDADGDAQISPAEAHTVSGIDCPEGSGARSLQGIEAFTSLKFLAWENDPLVAVDLSCNTRLEHLYLRNDGLREIDLSHNPFLLDLVVADNNLTELDLSVQKDLLSAVVGGQPLEKLVLPADSRLEALYCQEARLKQLDLTGCPRLDHLECNDNHLSELDLSGCPQLRSLSCWQNDLTALDLSGLARLESLSCAQNDFSRSGLDVSACRKLKVLWCNDDKLERLDVSGNPLLEDLGCYGNPLGPMLDLTANVRLDTLEIHDCPNLARVYLRTGTTVARGIVKDVATQVLYVNGSPPVEIPDPGFKAYLAANFDQDGDGEISVEEAGRIIRIQTLSDVWNIRSLKGIEWMPNLRVLRCDGRWIDQETPDQPYYFQGPYRWEGIFGPAGTLQEVDVSHNPKLIELSLSSNAGLGASIGTLDLYANPLLEVLSLGMTYLRYPEVSFLTELRTLDLSHLHGDKPDISSLTKLRCFVLDFPQDDRTGYAVDVSHCPDLEELTISTAGSVSDLSKNPKMLYLHLDYMALPELDTTGMPLLRELSCTGNRIRKLDVSANPQLSVLKAAPMDDGGGHNLLDVLYVSKGQVIPGVTRDRSEEYIPAQTKIVTK